MPSPKGRTDFHDMRVAKTFLLLFAFALFIPWAHSQELKPLSVADIEELIKIGVTPRRVVFLVEERGVNFRAAGEIRERLERAGADPSVTLAVVRAGMEFGRKQDERIRAEAERQKDEQRKRLEEETRKAQEERHRIEEARLQEEESRRAAEESRRRDEQRRILGSAKTNDRNPVKDILQRIESPLPHSGWDYYVRNFLDIASGYIPDLGATLRNRGTPDLFGAGFDFFTIYYASDGETITFTRGVNTFQLSGRQILQADHYTEWLQREYQRSAR